MNEEEPLRGTGPEGSNEDVPEDSRQAGRPGMRRGGGSFYQASTGGAEDFLERPLAPPFGILLRRRSKTGAATGVEGKVLPGGLPRGMLVQRSASDTGPAVSGEVEEGAGSQVEGVVDPRAVAEMVYRMMRRELALERERAW